MLAFDKTKRFFLSCPVRLISLKPGERNRPLLCRCFFLLFLRFIFVFQEVMSICLSLVFFAFPSLLPLTASPLLFLSWVPKFNGTLLLSFPSQPSLEVRKETSVKVKKNGHLLTCPKFERKSIFERKKRNI